jgi:aspartyl-tRNA(Asn)/glutamyl-tRNA(Gln) amidotransferase subunit B
MRRRPVPEGYDTVIGLEVHCELSTATKLFCGCANHFGSEPNTNICPVCLGLPGSLPVLNRQAVVLAMRIGAALGCRVEPSIFHRKNYFYPDMPKDYQISQYDEPINVDGSLDLPDGSCVGIVRAHIEEDTGKTTHVGGGGGRIHGASHSLVDYNRAGVPLVEIVSAPDIRSARQARDYVAELRGILVATGASDGRMEEGSLRVDANISLRPTGAEELGTRCEVKNLNSLRSLVRAIEYEAERQAVVLGAGDTVHQETRHWDENASRTHSLRSKEEAYDYRYFPEPDLVPVVPDEALFAAAAEGVGTMPAERRRRLGALVSPGEPVVAGSATADVIQTVIGLDLDSLVLAAVAAGADSVLALNRAANDAASRSDVAQSLDPAAFAALIKMESSGKLSATQAKAVLGEMLDAVEAAGAVAGGDSPAAVVGGAVDPAEIARRLGYEAMESSDLDEVIDAVIAANTAEWERYVGGDEKVAGFLAGQVMKSTKGRANGKLVAAAFAARR